MLIRLYSINRVQYARCSTGGPCHAALYVAGTSGAPYTAKFDHAPMHRPYHMVLNRTNTATTELRFTNG